MPYLGPTPAAICGQVWRVKYGPHRLPIILINLDGCDASLGGTARHGGRGLGVGGWARSGVAARGQERDIKPNREFD